MANINSLEEIIQQGAVGDVPEFKQEGDADTDAFSQTMRDFYKGYFQGWHKMNLELADLEERDVFDDLLLANKYFMGSEIRKSIVGQAASVSSNLIRRERNGWKSFYGLGCDSFRFS
jgi:hypothetical protein